MRLSEEMVRLLKGVLKTIDKQMNIRDTTFKPEDSLSYAEYREYSQGWYKLIDMMELFSNVN